MELKSFLKQNALQQEDHLFVVSQRFLDDQGKPIEWRLRAISSQQDEILRKESTKKVQIKRNQYQNEIDTNKYIGLLAAACTIYPNLSDAALQDSYGVMGADELLKAMLLPGEYADYLLKVQEICGFDQNINDLVDKAKN